MKLCPLRCLPCPPLSQHDAFSAGAALAVWLHAGGAAVLIFFLYHPSRHSFPVTCLLLQRIALEIPSTGYNGEEMGHFHFCICKSLSVLVWVTFYGLILYLMTSSATLNCLVWAHAFQMEVMGIDACSCWGHWQASASAGLVLGAVSQWLRLWPGAFGSASTLAPGLAVLRVWAWAVSTLLVLALKHFGTKLQRSLCNITHVLIF